MRILRTKKVKGKVNGNPKNNGNNRTPFFRKIGCLLVPHQKGIKEAVGTTEGEKTASSLIKMLKDKNIEARINAASALGEKKDREAVEPLMRRFEMEQSNLVKIRMAEALGKIGDGRAAELLADALDDLEMGRAEPIVDENGTMSYTIRHALGNLMKDDMGALDWALERRKEKVKALEDLKSNAPELKMAAAEVFGRMRCGEAAELLVEMVREAVKDGNDEVSKAAMKAVKYQDKSSGRLVRAARKWSRNGDITEIILGETILSSLGA